MSAGPGYRDLVVWQKGVDLVVEVYRSTRQGSPDERFGLVSQIQRAAASIPSNIAEGQGRSSRKAFLHHLSIANGSLCEVETQLVIAQRLGYIDTKTLETVTEQSTEIARMLSGLTKRLRSQLESAKTHSNPQSFSSNH